MITPKSQTKLESTHSNNSFNVCLLHYEEVYPPRSGAQLRTWEFSRNLCLKGHSVVIIQLSKKARHLERSFPMGHPGPTIITLPTPKIIRYVVNATKSRATQKALSVFLINVFPFYLPYLLRTIISKKIDIVQSEGLNMSLPSLLMGRLLGKVAILDDQNAETLLATRLYYFSKAKENRSLGLSSFSLLLWQKFVLILEKASCNFANLLIVPSDIDANFLISGLKASPKKTNVILNGATLESHNSSENNTHVLRKILGINEGDEIITFVGNMSYPPNLYALRWIIATLSPGLAKMRPTAKIVIVGPLTSDNIGQLPKNVVLAGEVPDVAPYIRLADLCIAPLSVGGGTKVKVLYYLACGKAVITTHIGAEGLRNSCLIESNLSEFVDKILFVLNDSELKRKLESEGRLFSMSFDWRILTEKLIALYGSATTCVKKHGSSFS